jgi:hypothetical protein
MRRPSRAAAVLLAMLLCTLAVPAASYGSVEPLPRGTDVDYQLGGASRVPRHVGIVVRDRKAKPAAGRYNVCYVNGFQTQEDEWSFWQRHPRLLLHDADGRLVEDEAWHEVLLDLRTHDVRAALARIVGRWVRGCADDGFDAVEFDNLDSFTRSGGLLKRTQAIAYARLLVRAAHAQDLAAGQKNLAGFDGRKVGYDFAIAEECARYDECSSYVAHYGRRVLVVEYRARDFRAACAEVGARLPVVLRDRALTPRGVHRWC